jgi:peptide/nickel transport system permease protein
VLLLVPTVLGLTLIVFMGVRFLPGDRVDQMLADYGPTDPEARARLEERYELNGNFAAQYVEWLGEIARGDFGRSFVNNQPIADALQNRIPVTFQLGLMAMVFSVAMAIPIGVISAVYQDRFVDYVARSLAIAMLSIPSFFLALLALIYGFKWFGYAPPLRYEQLWESPFENIRLLWLPALILSFVLAGSVMRLTRSTMLEVLRQDYVRTARAKGLRERTVVLRHGLRNALLPVITVIGLQAGVLIGGTVVLELIFSLPGMGQWLLFSFNARDYPVVQAVTLIAALVVISANIVVDISYAFVDPRIKYT